MKSTREKSSLRGKGVNRPFHPRLLTRARAIADSYHIILHFEDGEYYGRALELPTAMNDGKSPDECVKATREILTSTIAYLLEEGETPPMPASEGRRSEQVNVRLTPEEKLRLEDVARSKGFRGISDFIRSVSLEQAR